MVILVITCSSSFSLLSSSVANSFIDGFSMGERATDERRFGIFFFAISITLTAFAAVPLLWQLPIINAANPKQLITTRKISTERGLNFGYPLSSVSRANPTKKVTDNCTSVMKEITSSLSSSKGAVFKIKQVNVIEIRIA